MTSYTGIDAFLLKFEAETMQAQLAGTPTSASGSTHLRWLKQAVDAGEQLMQFLDAHTHYRQNLYNWVPSRPYIRALMYLGVVHFQRKEYRKAELLFNKMIGADHGDHLGARHYLVTIFLGSGNRGYGSKGFQKLMDSRYGDDNTTDTVFALWNYSRAIHCFANKMRAAGRRGSTDVADANALLEHAISINGYVPRFLLGHEITKTVAISVQIGGEIEAAWYVEQHINYWIATPGALQWLETVYLRLLGFAPGERDVDAITLEIRGGFHLRNQGKWVEALLLFKDLHPRIPTGHPMYVDASQCVAVIMLQDGKCADAAALLGRVLGKHPHAKGCRYLKADCHESLCEWAAARREYQYVMDSIGAFSTAYEGIARCTEMIRIAENGAGRGHCAATASDNDGATHRCAGSDDAAARKTAEAIAKLLDKLGNINTNPARGQANDGCTNCKKTGLKLRECQGCGTVRYCSKTCQTAGWKAHRSACKAISGREKNSGGTSAKTRKGKSKSKSKSRAGCRRRAGSGSGSGSGSGGGSGGGVSGSVSNVKVSSRVSIDGLVSRADLNTTKGTVLSRAPNGERWIVKLDVDGTSVSLTPARLTLV